MSRRHYLRVPRSAVRRKVPPGHDRGAGRAGSRLSLSGRSVSSPPPASISFPHPLSHGAFFDIPGQWRPTPLTPPSSRLGLWPELGGALEF